VTQPPPDPIISVRNVGVSFSKNRRRKRSLRDLLFKGTLGPGTNAPGEFWPFRNVSFDISPGESIGVVGRNGAGKSTMLRLIAGVLIPDEGDVSVHAGVAPLIALTGGFEGELSGRENIRYVSGLHGMSEEEIDDAFGEIVEFSEIGDFLDTPFKHYSSGMKVRLAFSVVSRLSEPILLVDEVLAVGDKAFKAKCLKRIDSLLEGGTTLFMVSHGEGALKRYCDRGLYLDGTGLAFDGPIEEAIEKYERDLGLSAQNGAPQNDDFALDSLADA
jgi:ABC-2 type transport system ATP-binding protein